MELFLFCTVLVSTNLHLKKQKQMASKYTPISMAEPCDIEEAKISNDDLVVFQENVFGLKVLMDDSPGVEVAHALRDLCGNVGSLVHVELVFAQVNVCVQGQALTQRGHQCQLWWFHAGTHEQD